MPDGSPRKKLEPYIWSSVIRNLQLPLADSGLDVADLLQAAGVDPGDLEHPHGQVLLSRYIQFLNLAAERAEDPLLGLKIAQVVGPEVLGAVGFLFLTSRNLLDGIGCICRYQQLFQDSTSLQLRRLGDEYIYTYSLYDIHNQDIRQDVEFSIAFSLRLIRMYANNQAQVRRITFRHAPNVHPSQYERLLRVRCQFHAEENSVVMGPAHLQERGSRFDPDLEQILRDYLDSDIEAKQTLQTTADVIKHTIRNEVGQKLVTAELVARRLGMSTSSLYRRLREDNTQFKTLLNEVYHELAMRYLSETNLTIAQISDMLGFSSPASFSRAFAQWSGGLTPRQARVRQQARA